jgi:hypothetical protein
MSDDLKKVYEGAGKLRYYFDEVVPRDLFRGQSRTEAKQGLPVFYPNPGFRRKDGTVREPDVLVEDVGGTPTVRGCRTLNGHHRGISTFDRPNTGLAGFSWYRLPAGTKIPEALAITQDSDLRDRPNHYTIAPKDDMPLALFQVWLNALGGSAVPEGTPTTAPSRPEKGRNIS